MNKCGLSTKELWLRESVQMAPSLRGSAGQFTFPYLAKSCMSSLVFIDCIINICYVKLTLESTWEDDIIERF